MDSQQRNISYSVIFFILIYSCLLKAQQRQDTISLVLEPSYSAGWFHSFLFGAHWRNAWTAKIPFTVIDYNTFSGGIIPYKKGGGFQTKSLRFKAKDGRVWKFRSMRKDPAKVLPEELRQTFAADVLYDQISASFPAAPLVVSELSKAARVQQTGALLCYLPHSPSLGEYDTEFGDQPGVLEINPDEDDTISYPGVEKAVGSFEMFDRLEKGKNESIALTEYLKARLFDFLIGDWDRHMDQWRWLMVRRDGRKVWIPVPRDRDQALNKYDGLLPSLASYYVQQITNFDSQLPQVEKISWSGRYLDRRILPAINKTQWDSVSKDLQNSLSDSVIDNAVKTIPHQISQTVTIWLSQALKNRRDNLHILSDQFYDMIHRVVDIYLTDQNEDVTISSSDSRAIIDVSNTGKNRPEKRYEFDCRGTDEIRIYIGAGKDKAYIKDDISGMPVLRIINSKGDDSVITIGNSENSGKVYLYGFSKKRCFEGFNSFRFVKYSFPDSLSDTEKYEPQQKDRGYDLYFYPYINLNDDDGLTAGGGYRYTSYGFNAIPAKYGMGLYAYYATKPRSYKVEFDMRLFSIAKHFVIAANITRSDLTFTKYFGYGNETGYNRDLEENDFYRVEQDITNLDLAAKYEISESSALRISLRFRASDISFRPNTYMALSTVERQEAPNRNLTSFNFDFAFDNRDNRDNANAGSYALFAGEFFPGHINVNEFKKISFETAVILPIKKERFAGIVLRAGGMHIIGKQPFFESAMLGGEKNLRGYSKDRFAGKSSLFGQMEVRAEAGKFSFIVPATLGFLCFAETGRVYDKSASKMWHPSFGGGFWLSFLRKEANIAIVMAASPERMSYYLKTKMML